jgi:hypothetical protein
MADRPRLIRTYLIDGTLEGIRIIDCETTVNAVVIPRIKLAEAKELEELSRPALYFLVNAEGDQAYIGEAENFYNRIKNHDQNKDWWDIAIAIVSATNELDKAGVKYLESLSVERARNGSMQIENKVVPARNNISRFDVHRLENILEDTQLVLTSLNYDILSTISPAETDDLWYLNHKGTVASGEYRGTQFVLLAGSTIHTGATERWVDDFPKIHAMREEALRTKATISGEVATTKENIAFRSVSMAAGFVTGRHSNGWKEWKNADGKTMDEIMRKAE